MKDLMDGAPGAAPGDSSGHCCSGGRGGTYQPDQSDEVVGGRHQIASQLGSFQAAVARPAEPADRACVVTREEILDTLWGMDYVAESNIVDRQIRNLRARFQHDWRQPRFIATVTGRGYRFLPTSSDSGAAAGVS